MAGLRRIVKAFGAMIINGERWVWDYARDEAVPDRLMPEGGERWEASERAKWSRAQ